MNSAVNPENFKKKPKRTPQRIASEILAYPLDHVPTDPVDREKIIKDFDPVDTATLQMSNMYAWLTGYLEIANLPPEDMGTQKKSSPEYQLIHSAVAIERLREALMQLHEGQEPDARIKEALKPALRLLALYIKDEKKQAKDRAKDIPLDKYLTKEHEWSLFPEIPEDDAYRLHRANLEDYLSHQRKVTNLREHVKPLLEELGAALGIAFMQDPGQGRKG